MPRDASGNYTLPAGNPVVSGEIIDSNWANPTMEDIANELTNSLSRDGQGGMLAAFKFTDGTAGAPGISWTSEPSSGIYRAASSDMRATIAGVPRMRWTSTGVDVWEAISATWIPLVTAAGINFIPATGGTIIDLEVENNGEIGGDLNVVGDVTVGGGLTVVGTITFDDVTLADLHVTGTIDVDGNANFDGTMQVDGAATFDATVQADGSISATGGLIQTSAAGSTTFNDVAVTRSGAGADTLSGNVNLKLSNSTDATSCQIQKSIDGGLQFWMGSNKRIQMPVTGGISLFNGGVLNLYNSGNTVAKSIYLSAAAVNEVTIAGRGAMLNHDDAANISARVIVDTAAANTPANYKEGDLWLQYTP